MHMETVAGKCTIYLQTIEFSRHLITKHLRPTYSCIDPTISGLLSPASSYFLKHTGTIRHLTQILWNSIIRLRDEIKMAHFLSPCKEQINFLRPGLDIFLSLGFLIFGAAPWLAPGGGSGAFGCMPRRRTVTSAAAGLFVPRLRELPSFSLPRHLPKRNEMDRSRSEARRREAELILVDTCCTGDITPHLTIYFCEMTWIHFV